MSINGALDDLLDRADMGAVIVTATHRLARSVRAAHDRRAIAAGARAWRGIDVLPADAWLRRLWSDALDAGCVEPRALLSDVQAHAIWESLVAALPIGNAGGDLYLLARTAADAWRALRDAGADESALAGSHGADAARTARCFAAFRERLEAGAWIDSASISAALRDAPLDRCELPSLTVFAGFDRAVPALGALAQALSRTGCRTERWMPAPRLADPTREVLPTPYAESWAAARWARAILEARPCARIGVVVPDLHERRTEIERAFEEVLLPGPARHSGAGPRPFALSLGAPLARAAPVADALALLQLATAPVEPALLARALTSPFLVHAERERIARSAMARAVRAEGETAFDLDRARALVRRVAPGATPALGAALTELRELVSSMPGRRGAGAWADLYWRALLAAGWPGEQGLDSEEHQSVEALRDTVSAFASLEAVLGPLTAREGAERLRRLCAERIFAPRAEPTRVEITGLLETGGEQFTHLRVLGMDDLAWPPPARPNPLLPVPLQARLEVPQSTPSLCLEHAEVVGARLLASAGQVVITHAARNADEVRRASPLFASIPLADTQAPQPCAEEPSTGEDWTFTDVLARAAPPLEQVPAPALPALDDGTFVRGGARVLQDQAACGFRAFARHRLMVSGAEHRDDALDASARGAIAHAVLEQVWRRLGSHAELVATTLDERRAIVTAAVAEALAGAARLRPAIRGRLREIEQRRLARLVLDWLELETRRPPFEVVAPERDARIRVGPLELALRPDRIDRLEDGRHLVIDYKTGAAEIRGWFGERPDDPQVPLYASHLMGGDGTALEVGCGAFAVLRADGVGLRGLGLSEEHVDGVREVATSRYGRAEGIEDWHGALEAWRTAHVALARAFAQGRAEVDPKRWPATCRYCEIRTLCRIDELRRDAGEEDASTLEGPAS